MDMATVLNTFETYREDFERLYQERQHKFQTMSYMTIDHCHIMDMLNKNISFSRESPTERHSNFLLIIFVFCIRAVSFVFKSLSHNEHVILKLTK